MRSTTRMIRNFAIAGTAVTGCTLIVKQQRALQKLKESARLTNNERATNRFPSYADILEEDSDIKVEPVSQYQSFGNRQGFGNGICVGLSITQILRQLRLKAGETSNPFNYEEDFKNSADIQHSYSENYSGYLEKWRRKRLINPSYQFNHTYSKDYLERELSLTNKSKAHIRDIPLDHLEQKLKKKIARTDIDRNSRGILIYASVYRNAKDGEPMPGGHVLSMTIQNINEQLYCTGMDANMFFATGKGKSGCDKIADKMATTLSAYDADTIQTYTANTAKMKG
jgi:hypothetical protein